MDCRRLATHRKRTERITVTAHIGARHLKHSGGRKTICDSDVKGFALRTTPNVNAFYFHYLNKLTKKREWHKIGDHPAWSVDEAREEARRLRTLAAKGEVISKGELAKPTRIRRVSSPVRVTESDYGYDGWLVATFSKRSREVRCVVEDVNGRLYIHSPKHISPRAEKES